MDRVEKTAFHLQRLVAIQKWRFAIGLRIRFNNPALLYQTYPDDWIQIYARQSLVLVDPAVAWGMTNIGVCDWADLAANDTAGVLAQAANFGLRYGIVVSVGDASSRSLGFFAAPDAPLGPAERDLAQAEMLALHDLTEGVELAPAATRAAYAALNDGLRDAHGRGSG